MLKTESYKKGIIYSTGFNIIAKGIYFLNTLMISFYFRAGLVKIISLAFLFAHMFWSI
jgi:hypothetical protein